MSKMIIYFKLMKKVRRLYNHIYFWSCGIEYTPQTLMNIRRLRRKNKNLAKFGGRTHVSGRGALSHRFNTKAGEIAYEKDLRNRISKNIK